VIEAKDMTRQTLMIAGLIASAGVVFGAGNYRDREKAEGRMGRRTDLVRLKEQLGLTDAQADQLRALWTEQAKSQIRRRAELAIARLELRQLLLGSTVDEKAVAAKAKEVGELQSAAVRARVDGHLAMRKVLTPDQQKKLRDLPGLRPVRERHEDRRPGGRGAERGAEGDENEAPTGAGPSDDDASLTADEVV
jgi:Spy/CpxP family protein refolding chaperone